MRRGAGSYLWIGLAVGLGAGVLLGGIISWGLWSMSRNSWKAAASPGGTPIAGAASSFTSPISPTVAAPIPTPATRAAPTATERPGPLTSEAMPSPSPALPASVTPAPVPVSPPPSAASLSTPAPSAEDTVSAYESSTLFQAYDWSAALVPSTSEEPFYPYPRLNFDAVGGLAPRTGRLLVLENDCVRVSVLPELGGRIWAWEDRRTGRRLTYANPVLKPTRWGYRGWWLATGGVEWAFPVDEHGLNEARPWQSEFLSGAGWRGIRVWDTEDRTGLTVEVTLRLEAGRCDLIVQPRIANPTAAAQRFQFWDNMMLDLSGRGPTPELHFWLPTEEVIIHSTQDGSLPAAGERMAWPVAGGRDFSRYGTWSRYLGIFAAEARGAVGLYEPGVDQGIVRTYPPELAPGVKIFGLGDLPAALYTDGESRYLELWGGYTRTFWDYAELPAGGAVSWEERWYPVRELRTLSWADAGLAAGLWPGESGLEVSLDAPAEAHVQLILRCDRSVVAEWETDLRPAAPFRRTVPDRCGEWALEIRREGRPAVEVRP